MCTIHDILEVTSQKWMSPGSRPPPSRSFTSVKEREAASVQLLLAQADRRGGKPKITAAAVEMREVGGDRWGAEVREDSKQHAARMK